MSKPTSLDASFWSKLVQDCDLSVSNSTILQYTMALADRFSTVEEFLAADEEELINIGITVPENRLCLIKQARLFDEKEHSLSLSNQTDSRKYSNSRESWPGDHQSTPLNSKSICDLSLAFLSRISFNDQPTPADSHLNDSNPMTNNVPFDNLIETPKRSMLTDPTEILSASIHSCPRKSLTSSTHKMRTVKSLSDSISLQRKIATGTERLKRLTISRSLLKRQTAVIRKCVNYLKNRFFRSFNKRKSNSEPKLVPEQPLVNKTPHRLVNNRSVRPKSARSEPMQMKNSTDEEISSEQEPSESILHTNPTLTMKRFKLGATTSFVTRSIASRSQHE